MTNEVLVTGGKGMIGRYVDMGLSKKNISVDISTQVENEVSRKDGIFRMDLTCPESIERLVSSGYKAIINMAGISDPKICQTNPEISNQVNHLGVINILETIKHLPEDKRPIVILACSVLQFDIKEGGLISVDHPHKISTDPYIKSKNQMFIDAQPYLQAGLDIRFAFIANTTGEGHPLGYFPTDMANKIIKNEKVTHGPIDHKRPFLHGQDASSIFFYGLTHLQSGDKFLVSGEQSIKLSDFLATMIKISGKKDIEVEESPDLGSPTNIKDINFDITFIKSLGYKQIMGVPEICQTLLRDRARILNEIPLPARGVYGY